MFSAKKLVVLGAALSFAIALATGTAAFADGCASGHTPVVDPAVEATYTSTGLTEGSHCEVCGDVIVGQTVIPMKTLAKPSKPSATNTAKGIQVTWSKVTGAQSYRVFRNGVELKSTSVTSYLDSGTVAGKRYTYKVRAVAGENQSAASASRTTYRIKSIATRKALCYGTRFIARWNCASATQKVSGYKVRYSTTKSMKSPVVKKVADAKEKSCTVVISENRKSTYYVQVRAYRKAGSKTYYGAWSQVRKVRLGSVAELKDNANIKDCIKRKLAHGTKTAKYQKYIVLHDTEGNGSPQSFANYFASTGTYVAAHFVVSRNGSVGQIVDIDKIAHHAGYGNKGHNKKYGVKKDGRDDMRGTKSIGSYCPDYGMNAWSIGIEMEHLHGHGYTTAQLKALDKLIAYIDAYYGFESTIIDHKAWRAGNSDTDSTFKTYLKNYKKYRSYKKPAA